MVEAIEAIRAHAADRDADVRLRRDAILYNLVILGEAVKGISEETRARSPAIPWRKIAGLRDLLAHEYYRIDMTEIQDVIDHDLGPLAFGITALRAAKGPRAEASAAENQVLGAATPAPVSQQR
jgi:uncharacterized protein with HEPN domain